MKYKDKIIKRLLKYIEYLISTYTIIEVDEFKDNPNQLGSQDPRDRTIRILKNLPLHRKKHVLLHELAHLLLFELFLTKRLFIEKERLGLFTEHKKLDWMATKVLETIGEEDV